MFSISRHLYIDKKLYMTIHCIQFLAPYSRNDTKALQKAWERFGRKAKKLSYVAQLEKLGLISLVVRQLDAALFKITKSLDRVERKFALTEQHRTREIKWRWMAMEIKVKLVFFLHWVVRNWRELPGLGMRKVSIDWFYWLMPTDKVNQFCFHAIQINHIIVYMGTTSHIQVEQLVHWEKF